jgi:hypothetical protein
VGTETQTTGDAAAQAAAAAAAQQTPEQKAAADKAAADAAAASAAQTPEQKAAAEKAAADKAAADKAAGKTGAPEKYEAFKLPDGVTFAPELQAGLEGFAKKAGLNQEGAQELATFAAAQIQGITAQAEKVRNDWKAAAEKDPEIGGDKLPKALADGAAVIATFGGANATEFQKYLDTSGLGNHPVLIKILANVRAAISDDKFVPSGKKSAETKDARSMFPNSNMNP